MRINKADLHASNRWFKIFSECGVVASPPQNGMEIPQQMQKVKSQECDYNNMTEDLDEIMREITDRIIDNLKNEVKLIFVFGSASCGNATSRSDIDVVVVTRGRKYARTFLVGERAIDIWSTTFEELESMISEPSNTWCVAVGMIFQNKILYGDHSLLDLLRKRFDTLDEKKFMNFVATNMPEFYSMVGKLKNAGSQGDWLSLRWVSVELANTAANFVAMMNMSFYRKTWGKHFDEILKFKVVPEGFRECYETLYLEHNDSTKLIAAGEKLFSGFLKLLQERGVSVPIYSSIKDAFLREVSGM